MPRSISPVLLALACLGIAGTVAAADVVVADVRIGIGIGPMPGEQVGEAVAPASEAGTTLTQRYDDTPGLAFAVTSVYGHLAPVGVLAGVQFGSTTGEMDYKSMTYGGTTITSDELVAASGDKMPGMSFSQSSIAANLGIGWSASPSCHFELLAIAGLAYTTMDSPSNLLTPDMSVQEGQGWGTLFGGRLGAYYTDPGTSWQAGIELEYTSVQSELETVYEDIKFEVDVDNDGLGVRFVLGRRF